MVIEAEVAFDPDRIHSKYGVSSASQVSVVSVRAPSARVVPLPVHGVVWVDVDAGGRAEALVATPLASSRATAIAAPLLKPVAVDFFTEITPDKEQE